MLCQKHAADCYYEYDGGEHNRCLMIAKMAIGQSVHNEDAVINTDTEDKGRYDDADEIELHAKYIHNS